MVIGSLLKMIENSFYFTIQVNFVLFIFLLLSVTVSGAQECFTKFLNLLYKNSLNFLEALVVCCDSLILFYITLHEFPEIISLWFNAVKLQKRNKRRKFLQSKVLFVFGVLLVPFWNIRNFLRVDYFYFWIWESYFLKYNRNIRQGSFIFRNIRKLRFSKYKKVDYNISYKLLRPSHFLEKFIEILK